MSDRTPSEELAIIADALARLAAATLRLAQLVKKDRSLNQKE